jgi:uncharacterized protein (TIGR00251 family)
MIDLTNHAEGVILLVRAQPGARKNAVLGERSGALRVAVSAPPERGKANEAILEVVADALGCRTSALQIVSGATSRMKRVLVTGMDRQTILDRIERLGELEGKEGSGNRRA